MESDFLPLWGVFKSLFSQDGMAIPGKDGKIHFVPTTKILECCFISAFTNITLPGLHERTPVGL